MQREGGEVINKIGTMRYMPFIVYNNLKVFFEMRGIVTSHTWLDKTSFISAINTYEHIKIEGHKDAQYVMCWLLSPESKYGSRAPEYKKLLNMVPGSKAPGSNFIIVSQEEPSTHVRKAMEEYRSEHPGVTLEHHMYEVFHIVIPRHVAVPRHVIAPKAEVDAWCQEYGFARDDLQRISVNDPPVIWIGGRHGDVIKIYRTSESAGKAVSYRYVT